MLKGQHHSKTTIPKDTNQTGAPRVEHQQPTSQKKTPKTKHMKY
jgi:hypothetical protein